MKILCWGLLALLYLSAADGFAVETGYVLKATDLKAKPFLDAETVSKLPEKTPLEILTRQGPWMQVKIKDNNKDRVGFVRMLQVRLNVTDTALAATSTGSTATTVAAAVTRPAGASPTVTTGVRGFDEIGLKNAQPAPAEFEKMVGFAATALQAQEYAQKGQLAPRSVTYYGEDGKSLKEVK
jgi:hypothetical protein